MQYKTLKDIFAQTEAVIFDMDGLLIDSEPYWKMAEKEVFGKLGVHLTDDLLRQVMGFRLSEVVQYWYKYQPWENPDFGKTEKDVLACVKELILNHAEAMPGVYDILEFCKKQNYKIGLASSSAMSLIEVVVQKLQIQSYFDVIWSAEYEPFGKPHPGIFITTANKLMVEAKHCLVFEDSVNGVIAAKAARMHCIAVPEQVSINDPRFTITDLLIPTLKNVTM